MMDRFYVIRDPSEHLFVEAAAMRPANPFCTAAYASARRELGAEPWLLVLERQTTRVLCPAFLATGRLSRLLELPSWPGLEEVNPFWEGLTGVCRTERITMLEVNSFASESAELPVPGAVRRARREYVMDLVGLEIDRRVATNHLRNIKKATRAGLALRRQSDPGACQVHARLMGVSLARRQGRGEQVERATEPQVTATTAALVGHGAGTLYQAVAGEEVQSSILVLMGTSGGYYHSAGTSAAGMESGASHFLIHAVTRALQAAGCTRFNLGGVDEPGSGLDRFKAGFGAMPVELQAAAVDFSGPVRRLATALRATLKTAEGRWRTGRTGAQVVTR
jgi:hypothetical protein